jgi:UDP-N-acetylmuramate--alanine ligase
VSRMAELAGPDGIPATSDAGILSSKPEGWSGDLAVPGRFHVVGAGGSGMSAIATVLAAMGHRVTGSDRQDSAVLRRLRDVGVATWVGHDTARLADIEALTASTAVRADDAELAWARDHGIPVLSRADMLAAICATRRVLAVAGTHGKTTTSSMLAAILVAAGLRPSFIVGGDIAGVGPGARWDTGEWMVVEADESDGTFLRLGAEGVVVTSLEADHLDFYGDMAHLEAAFAAFVSTASGPRVVCIDGSVAAELAQRVPGSVTTYGTSSGAQLQLSHLDSDRAGVGFDLELDGEPLGSISLAVPGRHNALNATGALALARGIGVSFDVAVPALEHFGGVARRFERRGERRGVTFVDDYGHLPGEVAVVMATAAAGGWDRVVAVFQPHRYSRTAALWQDFADSFVGADLVILTDVYAAGEAPIAGVSGALIADAVRAAHPELQVRYVPTWVGLIAELDAELRAGDLCLTLGAGDLTTLPDQLLVDAAPEGDA